MFNRVYNLSKSNTVSNRSAYFESELSKICDLMRAAITMHDQKNGNIVSVKNLRSTKSMAAIAKQALESHTSLPHDCSFVIGR